MPSFSRRLALLIAIAVAALLVACSSDTEKPTPTPAETSTPAVSRPAPTPAVTPTMPPLPDPAPIVWSACGSFQCGSLSVPLDYARPNGRQIEIAMMRLQARNPGQRIGSLLVNYGGPGGSGLAYLPAWQATLPGIIRDRFDLVTFDPRGVGESEPIRCNDNIQEVLGLDPTPETPEQWAEVERVSKALADLCASRHRDLLPYVGTVNVVRDLEQMRKALGDEKLTYLGYSYGTAIGAVYAEMFPDRVRALVLDGAIDISLSGDDVALGQALGFEGALQDYIAYCAARSCITGFGSDPRAGIMELTRRAEAAPIPAPGTDRPAGPGELYNAIAGAMYTESYWPILTRAINSGLDGNGTQIVQLADMLWQRNRDGSYPNLFEVLYAVNCVDYAFNRDPLYYRRLAETFSRSAPYFGSALAEGELPCAYWAAEPTPMPRPRAAGAPPILVIGTTRDPATPYQWAVALAEQLESGVLLTNRDVGHTAYPSAGCVNNAVNTYLVEGTPPPEGTICGSEQYATPINIRP